MLRNLFRAGLGATLLLINPMAARADKAASDKSVSNCANSLKTALVQRQFGGIQPFCTMVTPSGVEIKTIGDYDISLRKNDLMFSDLRNFIKVFLGHHPEENNGHPDKLIIEPLPTARVYKLSRASLNDVGIITQTLHNLGDIRSYAVLGASRMYWVRCNVGEEDGCVIFVDIFGRNSPDGDIIKPDKTPWAGRDSPCFLWIRHAFKEAPEGANLPEAIDAIEALTDQLKADQMMPDIYQQYCDARGTFQ